MTTTNPPNVKKWSVLSAITFVAWCCFEYFVLRGDVVLSRIVDVSEEISIVIPISSPNEPHFGQIGLGLHAIGFELYDPEGKEIYRHHEEFSVVKPRRFEFTPRVTGNYELYIQRNERIKYASKVPASVKILVNDKRLFTYMFGSNRGEFF